MLEVPLSLRQVEAASHLHATVPQWQLFDLALKELAKLMPGWSDAECIIKCVSIDRLYNTQVYAILPMAGRVKQIFETRPMIGEEERLVELIAKPSANMKPRWQISFASKLCHNFVSEDRFPIYDSAARDTLKLHLGKRYIDKVEQPYEAFRENLRMLRECAGIEVGGRCLDRYLWLVGLSRRWWMDDRKPNQELFQILSKPSSEQAEYLDELLPRSWNQKFRTLNHAPWSLWQRPFAHGPACKDAGGGAREEERRRVFSVRGQSCSVTEETSRLLPRTPATGVVLFESCQRDVPKSCFFGAALGAVGRHALTRPTIFFRPRASQAIGSRLRGGHSCFIGA